MRVWTGIAPKWVQEKGYGTPRQFTRHSSATPLKEESHDPKTQQHSEEPDQPRDDD